MIFLKYLISLGLTLFIECFICGIQSRNTKMVIFVALMNVLTNPLANLFYNGLNPIINHPRILLAVIEVIVVLLEGILLYLYRRKDRDGLKGMSFLFCMLYGFELNAISFTIGEALNMLIY